MQFLNHTPVDISGSLGFNSSLHSLVRGRETELEPAPFYSQCMSYDASDTWLSQFSGATQCNSHFDLYDTSDDSHSDLYDTTDYVFDNNIVPHDMSQSDVSMTVCTFVI